MALLTGVVFGLAPAFEASNIKLNDTLKEAGRSLAGPSSSRRLRSALVVAEVALALVFLVGAGLLIRSFLRLQGPETGFNARNVLTMRVALPGTRYNHDAKHINFLTQALERMRALPGVEAAGAINYTPFLGLGAGTGFDIEVRAKPSPTSPWVRQTFAPPIRISFARSKSHSSAAGSSPNRKSASIATSSLSTRRWRRSISRMKTRSASAALFQ